MGFVPDCGSTHILAQLPDEIGTFLLLTGKRMRGWDLLYAFLSSLSALLLVRLTNHSSFKAIRVLRRILYLTTD